jgi:hypothetical protein
MFPSFRAPETMTAAEQASLLKTTAVHDDPRDHVLYSMALGTGLRLRELLGLNVSEVSPDGRQVRRRVVLDTTTTKGRPKRGSVPTCPVPDEAEAVPGVEAESRPTDVPGCPAVPLRPGPETVASGGPVALCLVAGAGGIRPEVRVPCSEALRRHQRLPGFPGSVPGPAIRFF